MFGSTSFLTKVANKVFFAGRIRAIVRTYPIWKEHLDARDMFLCGIDVLLKREVVRTINFDRQPISVRTNSPDLSVAISSLCEGEYDCIQSSDPKVIVDAGANIGTSAIFFAKKFPEAKIIAIEPESSNYLLLQRNTEEFRNVYPENVALWGGNESRILRNRNTGHWGYTIVPSEDGSDSTNQTVECVTLSELMVKHGVTKIDILKMDIEGSEKDVLEKSRDWIERVDVLTVELHDRIVMGCSRAFYLATAEFAQFEQCGEKVTAYRCV